MVIFRRSAPVRAGHSYLSCSRMDLILNLSLDIGAETKGSRWLFPFRRCTPFQPGGVLTKRNTCTLGPRLISSPRSGWRSRPGPLAIPGACFTVA